MTRAASRFFDFVQSDANRFSKLKLLFALGILCLISGFILEEAPVTWNEIFILDTLKRISDGSSIASSIAVKPIGASEINLSVAFLYPPWLLQMYSAIADVLQNALPEAWLSEFGAQLTAMRITSLVLAFLLLLPLYQHLQTQQSGLISTPAAGPRSSPLLPFFGTASLLLALARVAAVEQLLILASVVPLQRLSKALPVQTHTPRITLLLFACAAILIAVSGSVTWAQSLLCASALFLLLVNRSLLAFQRAVVWPTLITLLCFVLFFTAASSYESLIHHINLRHLANINMLQLEWTWPGSSLIWRSLAFILALFALRRLLSGVAFALPMPRTDVWLNGVVLSSGLFLSFHQTTPRFEDLVLQFFFFLCSSPTRASSDNVVLVALPRIAPLAHPALVRVAKIVWSLVWVLAALTPLTALVLMLSPATTLIPEFKAWLDASVEIALENFQVIALFLCCWLFFVFFVLRKKQRPFALHPFLLTSSLSAWIFFISTLRSECLWEHLQKTVANVPSGHTILHVPPLDPFLRIMQPKQKTGLVAVNLDAPAPLHPNHPFVVLLLPASASDLCQSSGWKIESKHGIFALCTMGRDSLWKLHPLN